MAVWDVQQEPKEFDVAILVPTRGDISMEWATRTIVLGKPQACLMFYDRFSTLDVARNNLVEAALKRGAKRLFFLDDDVLMPPDGLMKLIAAQDHLMATQPKQANGLPAFGPVVSGMYFAKKMNADGTFQEKHPAMWARQSAGDPMFRSMDVSKFDQTFVACDVIGAGCMLVLAEVFQKTPKPWFKWTVNAPQETLAPGEPRVSEDFFFNLAAEKAIGVKPVVMHEVRCDHLVRAKITGQGTMSLQV